MTSTNLGDEGHPQHGSFARHALTPEVEVWTYRFRGQRGGRFAATSDRLEIGIQLGGAWRQRGHLAGDQLYGANQVHLLQPGELYDLGFESIGDDDAVVGLSVALDELIGLSDPDREIRLVPTREASSQLVALGRELASSEARGVPLAGDDVVATVKQWIQRHGDSSPPSRLIEARRHLERYVFHDLYLEHIAEIASMRPTPFLRAFARRYGITPVQYRIKLRLNEAARRLWLQPRKPVEAIATDCGFSNLGYFRRAFRRYIGHAPSDNRPQRWPSSPGPGLATTPSSGST